MEKEFLNNKDKNRLQALKNIVNSTDESKFDNRFDKFEGETQYIKWEEIEKYIDWLAEEIEKRNKHYIGVYGIPRAGNIFATLLSYRTGLPILADPVEGCLVMDDDSSTGASLIPYINKCDIALMYKNPNCPVNPEYLYGIYGDIYLEFPWNKKNTFIN